MIQMSCVMVWWDQWELVLLAFLFDEPCLKNLYQTLPQFFIEQIALTGRSVTIQQLYNVLETIHAHTFTHLTYPLSKIICSLNPWNLGCALVVPGCPRQLTFAFRRPGNKIIRSCTKRICCVPWISRVLEILGSLVGAKVYPGSNP